MCLAIAKKPDGFVSKKWLRNAFESNKDGSGFAYINPDGKIQSEKFLGGFRKFYSALRNAERMNPRSPFLIHFRLATHGATDLNNCHPFVIEKKVPDLGMSRVAAVHNGIINIHIPKGSELSDTAMFLRKFIKPYLGTFLKNKHLRDVLEKKIGSNKVVFLTESGEFIFLNESLGHWKNDVWYSNSCYLSRSGFYSSGWSMTENEWNDYVDSRYGSEWTRFSSGSADVGKIIEKAYKDSSRLLPSGDIAEDGISSMSKCDICNGMFPDDDIIEMSLDGDEYDLCIPCMREWDSTFPARGIVTKVSDVDTAWGYGSEHCRFPGHFSD